MGEMGDNGASVEGQVKVEEEPPFPLTEVDKWVLSQTDEEFHLHDWEELKNIIGEDIYLCYSVLNLVSCTSFPDVLSKQGTAEVLTAGSRRGF